MSRLTVRVLSVLLLLAAVPVAACQTSHTTGTTQRASVTAAPPFLDTSEQLLTRIDPSWSLGWSVGSYGSYYHVDAFSPDGKHIAIGASDNGKRFIVLDGVRGKPYDAVFGFAFSPDSRRFAYIAREGAEYFIVLDGKEGKRYIGSSRLPSPTEPDPSSVSLPAFSPDSRHLAYVAKVGDRYCAVVDGVEGKPYESVDYDNRGGMSGIIFSPDSKRTAYVAGNAHLPGTHREFAVIEGVEEKAYDSVFGLVFSPDSKLVAYVAGTGDKRFAVIDGVEKPEEGVLEVVFSPNGKRVGYRAGAQGETYMVIDGVRGKKYESAYGLTFSPDSARTAYVAERDGKWHAVVDGSEGKPYERVSRLPIFSPDSRHCAYVAVEGDSQFVVVDGVEGGPYEGIRTLAFSPDSRRFAYIAYDLRAFFVVVDGVEGKHYTVIREQLVFGLDGKRLTYVATDGWGNMVVVDGAEGKQYDHILTRLRLPDGTIQTSLVFDSPSSLHYLAASGDNIYVVSEIIR